MEISAESAYLFRHAVVRDVAYLLQPPSERAVLHALALDVITDLPRLNEALFALELAQHARLATGREQQEKRYLKLGGDRARFTYDYPNALAAYQRLHELLGNEPAERAVAADALADLYERLGQWQEALTYFREVREHAADPLFVGRALVHLAWVGMESGEDVSEYLREGEKIADENDSDQLRIAFMMCHAKQLAADDDLAAALNVMREVIEFAKRTEDWTQELVGHSNAADYAAQAGDLDAAREHNDAAEKLARNPRAKHFLIGVLLNRASLAIRRREFDKAFDYASEALELGVETRSRGLVGSALTTRGIALTGQGQYGSALDTFEEVRPIIAETADATLAVRWLTARSELLRLWGKPELAIEELESAINELAGRVPDGSVHGVRLERALCRAALGQSTDMIAELQSLEAESKGRQIPVYRAGLLYTYQDTTQAVAELQDYLSNEPSPGVYAEPLEFLARAWLAMALAKEGRRAGVAAREALDVADRLGLGEHPSPPLAEMIERCVQLANENPDSVADG